MIKNDNGKIKIGLKVIIAICLALVIGISTFTAYKVMGDTIYIGGSSGAGSGQVGKWTISVPENYLALKIGVHKRIKGEFADVGYTDCYPDVGDNYIILVPTNGYKTKTVLVDINRTEANSSHVVYGGEGGAKSAVWNLFMKNTPTYKGDAKALIGNTEPSDWTSYITTESLNAMRVDNTYLNSTNGKMFVSNDLVDDETLNKQIAITGMAICQAINDAGGKLNLSDVGNYFMGNDSTHEYIIIIENAACMMDTANTSKGYWWVDNITGLSASLGIKIDPKKYKGSTNDFFKSLISVGFPIRVQAGANKTGFRLNSDNDVRNYLFNYLYTPTYGNNYWSLNAISSCLWYSRKEHKDKITNNPIWGEEFPEAVASDMTSDAKFGFNVLACFAYSLIEQQTSEVIVTVRHIDTDTKERLAEDNTYLVTQKDTIEEKERVFEGYVGSVVENYMNGQLYETNKLYGSENATDKLTTVIIEASELVENNIKNIEIIFGYKIPSNDLVTVTMQYIVSGTGEKLTKDVMVQVPRGTKPEDIPELFEIKNFEGYELNDIERIDNETGEGGSVFDWWKNIVGWIESLV